MNIQTLRIFVRAVQILTLCDIVSRGHYLQIECDARKQYCGTTALGAFVVGSKLLVFSIGDCQAVLCTSGAAVRQITIVLFLLH